MFFVSNSSPSLLSSRGFITMSRIPNPFLGGQGQQQKTPQKAPTPGFLLMTRPPTGSNSYGGNASAGFKDQYSPSNTSPSRAAESFIPFSAIGSNHDGNRRGGNRGGGGSGRYNRGGGRHMTNQTPQRFPYPYQQNAGRMPSPYCQGGQGYGNSPRGRQNHGNQRGGRFGGDHNRFNSNNGNNSRRMHANTPLSDVPIDKFVSPSMVKDPWEHFESDEAIEPEPCPVITLDNSEIIIDSDTSVVIENSYEEGVSGTEGDSSPVHDTGSDSPYVATSSTSEKDTGSDTASDA